MATCWARCSRPAPAHWRASFPVTPGGPGVPDRDSARTGAPAGVGAVCGRRLAAVAGCRALHGGPAPTPRAPSVRPTGVECRLCAVQGQGRPLAWVLVCGLRLAAVEGCWARRGGPSPTPRAPCFRLGPLAVPERGSAGAGAPAGVGAVFVPRLAAVAGRCACRGGPAPDPRAPSFSLEACGAGSGLWRVGGARWRGCCVVFRGRRRWRAAGRAVVGISPPPVLTVCAWGRLGCRSGAMWGRERPLAWVLFYLGGWPPWRAAERADVGLLEPRVLLSEPWRRVVPDRGCAGVGAPAGVGAVFLSAAGGGGGLLTEPWWARSRPAWSLSAHEGRGVPDCGCAWAGASAGVVAVCWWWLASGGLSWAPFRRRPRPPAYVDMRSASAARFSDFAIAASSG